MNKHRNGNAKFYLLFVGYLEAATIIFMLLNIFDLLAPIEYNYWAILVLILLRGLDFFLYYIFKHNTPLTLPDLFKPDKYDPYLGLPDIKIEISLCIEAWTNLLSSLKIKGIEKELVEKSERQLEASIEYLKVLSEMNRIYTYVDKEEYMLILKYKNGSDYMNYIESLKED